MHFSIPDYIWLRKICPNLLDRLTVLLAQGHRAVGYGLYWRKTLYSSSSWVTYEASSMRILEKINCVLTTSYLLITNLLLMSWQYLQPRDEHVRYWPWLGTKKKKKKKRKKLTPLTPGRCGCIFKNITNFKNHLTVHDYFLVKCFHVNGTGPIDDKST